jgi:lipopolysaccharide export system permease protein
LKTLHKYLVRQVLASLSLTVVVFTFVLMVGNLLKEILSLLVTGQARFGLMLEAIGLLVPFLWVYALPMGLLTATLLVFGRFSADQELTAARASGVSLVSLITPILLLSLVCCAVSAGINLELGPLSRVAYLNLIYRARFEMATVQLPEHTYIRDFPGFLFWVDKNRDGDLYGVRIARFGSDTNNPNPAMTLAHRGRLEIDRPNQVMTLWLTNANITVISGDRERDTFMKTETIQVDLKTATNQVYHPKISDMTYGQLRQEMRDQESLLHLAPAPGATPDELRAQMRHARQQQNDWTLPVRVEMNRRIAFSFASFGFALVGIPLGIRVHRRETNIGIVIALGLAVTYYSFILLGISLSSRPEFYPHLILWLPNFIFQAIGAVLLWRANRGF